MEPEEVFFIDIKIRSVKNGYILEGITGVGSFETMIFETREALVTYLKEKMEF